MKVIDSHAHIYPTKIEHKAVEAIRKFYELDAMGHAGSSDELLRSGAEGGITKFVVFSTATVPHQVESINNFILRECAAHPEFIPVGTLHADYEGYADELCRIDEAGMHGVKFHPDFQLFDIDDPRLFPMYDLLSERGMFIITHSGDPRHDYSRPEKVAHVAREFPKLRIIAAHFGGWGLWDVAREVLRGFENVYFDTSSTYGFTGADPIKLAFKTFDPSHIFFGCDFPMWDHATELRRIVEVLGEGQLLEDVCWNNFAAFYSRYGSID